MSDVQDGGGRSRNSTGSRRDHLARASSACFGAGAAVASSSPERDIEVAVRPFILAFVCVTAFGCGTHYIHDLPLVWTGVSKNPAASTAVDKAFAAVPIELGDLRDARDSDRSKVGTYEDDGFVVTTSGDVGAFWRGRLRAMLESAGARLESSPQARVDADLLQFDCIEGNTFNAVVRMRVTVTRPGGQPWSKHYEGRGKRWGRTHKEENFNEALSNALAEATRKLLQDEAFADALVGRAPGSPAVPAQPPAAGTAL